MLYDKFESLRGLGPSSCLQPTLPLRLPQLAFSAVTIALKLYVEDLERGDWRFHHGVVKKKEGAGPNEPGTFALKGYIGLQLDKAHSPVTGSPEREEEKAP